MSYPIEPKFGACNVVIVDDAYLALDSVLGPPVTAFHHWETGNLVTFPTSIPDVTMTSLPMPEGRMPNYALQKITLSCADAFLLILDTCGYRSSHWIEELKTYENVPVVCWIDRSREAESIASYQQNTIKSLKRQYAVQASLQANKDSEGTADKIHRESRQLYNYAQHYPVMDYEEMVKEIKTVLGPETPIYNFDSTGVPHIYDSYNQPETVTQTVKREVTEIRAIFETSIKMCVQLQKEKGVNPKVLENKQKNTKIERLSRFWDLADEEVKPKEKVTKEKAKGTTGLLSTISKFFSFGTNSKTVKA